MIYNFTPPKVIETYLMVHYLVFMGEDFRFTQEVTNSAVVR